MDRRRASRAAGLLLAGASAGLATCALPRATGAPAEHFGLQSLGIEIFLAAVALAGASASRQPFRARLGLEPGRMPLSLVSVLAGGTIAVSFALDGALELFGLRAGSALASFDSTLAHARGLSLVIALVGIGIAPGAAEELFFRGFVQRGLEARLGPAPAIVLAAALFGAFHGEAVYAIAAGVLGLYLGLVAYLAGSVRAAIACHVLNNLLAVAQAAIWPQLGIASPAATAAGFVVAAACLWWVDRRVAPARLYGSRDGGAIATAPGVLQQERRPADRLPGAVSADPARSADRPARRSEHPTKAGVQAR
jgi:membrane protease YdiL (CAAX protease family)